MTSQEFMKMIRECYKKVILNKSETAMELGGISISTLDRLREKGEIRSKKIRGQIMFKAEEIYRYLNEV